MRNVYTYNDFKKVDLLKALLNFSNKKEYISVLVSNLDGKESSLPKDYINYDIIAGIGKSDVFISNHDSFEKLKIFYKNKRDWLFGYLSYDLKNEIEDLNSDNIDNFNADNMSFFIPEYVLLLKNDQLQIETYHSKHKCDKFVRELDFSNLLHSVVEVEFSRRVDKEVYLQTVNKIKTHIQRGDIYELNYCQEFYSNEPKILPEVIFFELNELMQTPFSSFLKLKDKYILSVSPERFLRKKGNHVLSQPIKGTKKRGINKSEDKILINELNISQKDISENIMIADLVRNDLSINATKESVNVDELCKVYTFKKVHQMITSISCEIDSEISFTDVLKATFPMGSMTGAPKLRAMELIDYYENFKRGIFSGSIGYINPKGDFDFNVVIRTILYNLANNYISISVGGAITIQSNPYDEYEECIVKAKPLFDVFNFKIDD